MYIPAYIHTHVLAPVLVRRGRGRSRRGRAEHLEDEAGSVNESSIHIYTCLPTHKRGGAEHLADQTRGQCEGIVYTYYIPSSAGCMLSALWAVSAAVWGGGGTLWG